MGLFWGLTFGTLSLLAWGGQVLTWLAPDVAVRFGVTEAKETVDPAFWADVRGEAMWDSLTLWTGVVAGLLLVIDRAAWPFFGLVAGSSYLYFGGRGLSTRRELHRLRIRYGSPSNVAAARTLLSVWAVAGAIMIAAAVVALG